MRNVCAGRYSSATPNDGPGHGIYAGSLHDVQIIGNSITGGMGNAVFASGLHFVITGNVMAAGPLGGNKTGILVTNSVDVDVSDNNVRGFGQAVVATDKDTIRIRGNTIDVSHSPAASGKEYVLLCSYENDRSAKTGSRKSKEN